MPPPQGAESVLNVLSKAATPILSISLSWFILHHQPKLYYACIYLSVHLQSSSTSVHTWWAHFKAEPTQHIITPLYFMLLTNLHSIITSPKTEHPARITRPRRVCFLVSGRSSLTGLNPSMCVWVPFLLGVSHPFTSIFIEDAGPFLSCWS